MWMMLLAYPAPYRCTPTFPSVAAVLGTVGGFMLGASWTTRRVLYPGAMMHGGLPLCAHSTAFDPWTLLALRCAIGE